MERNALRSWHATMYKFVTSMVLCGLGMQQCAMHNATIQKTTFFELGVFLQCMCVIALTFFFHCYIVLFVARAFCSFSFTHALITVLYSGVGRKFSINGYNSIFFAFSNVCSVTVLT